MTQKTCDACHGAGTWVEYGVEMSCYYCGGTGVKHYLVTGSEHLKLLKALRKIANHKPSTTGNAIDAIADAYEDVKKMAREALK